MKTYEYPCIFLSKKGWKNSEGQPFRIVSFYAEAGQMDVWSGVYRCGVDEKGYQRVLKPKHSNEIKKFLEVEANVIPNSVVIAFNDKIKTKEYEMEPAILIEENVTNPKNSDGSVDYDVEIGTGTLKVNVHPNCVAVANKEMEMEEVELNKIRSASIIDGQHRVDGGNSASCNVYFPVTAFLGITKEDQAFHFIVINRKSEKVSSDVIEAVVPKVIYQDLQERLVSASIIGSEADIIYSLDNSDDSPFKNSIIWGNKPNRTIVKSAIDKIIKYSKQLPIDAKDLLSETDLIKAIWNGIKRHLAILWNQKIVEIDSENYKNQFLIKGAGVLPALQLVVNAAWTASSIKLSSDATSNEKKVENGVYDYIKNLPIDLFICTWNKKSITNESSIQNLQRLIMDMIRNKKVLYRDKSEGWFDDKKPIKKKNKNNKSKAKKIKKSK